MTAEMRGGVPVTPQQAAIVDHVREHPVTVVSAGAGSGKTYTMVATVLDLIERGLATVNQFVLITFTNKAADELRERIERALADRSRRAEREGDDAGRRLWQRQQERLAGAHIGTIHSYCAHVLKTYGYGERVAHTADISMARSLFTETLADTTEASLAGPDALLFSPDLDWDDHHAAHIIGAILDNIRQRGLIRRSCWRRRAPSPTMTASSTGSRSLTSSRGRTPPTPRGRTTSSASIATTCSAARPISSRGRAARRCYSARAALALSLHRRVPGYRSHPEAHPRRPPRSPRRAARRGRPKAVDLRLPRRRLHALADLAEQNAVAILPLNVSRRPTRKPRSAEWPVPGNERPVSRPRRPARSVGGHNRAHNRTPPLIYAAAETNDRDARIAKTADAIRWLLRQRIDDP
ncbi:MAG: UvrD-helicase domain-containing protein [Thermomicrobiales bacterium]